MKITGGVNMFPGAYKVSDGSIGYGSTGSRSRIRNKVEQICH